MRRLMPWVLVSLVAFGAAAGAALGIAHKTASEAPSQWVAAVLATTEKAGTAHFSYTHVTSSPNAELRGSLSGNGNVNFVTGNAQVTEVDHEISFSSTDNQPLQQVHLTNTLKAIVIGGTVYQADPIPGIGFTNAYRVLPFPKLPRAHRKLSLARAECRGIRAQPRSGHHRRDGHHPVRGHVCTPPRLCAAPAACRSDPTSELRVG